MVDGHDVVMRAAGIKKGYNVAGDVFWALKGVDLSIQRGKLTILKGRSGSGKTTLINILGALDHPTEGDVIFDGATIIQCSEDKRDAIRRREIGFIFQSVALVSMMTAYENVEFGLRISSYDKSLRKKRAEECLSLVGLTQRMHHMPQELSGGEQQRVAIARAIAHKPKIIFADEPTAELDTNTGLAVVKIFKDLIEKEGVSIVMTTHDPGLMDIADETYQMNDGEVIA